MYELTVVLPGDITPAKSKLFTENLKAMVKSSKGEIIKEDDWGAIDLSYKISKNTTGKFLYFELKLPADAVSDFNHKVMHTVGVIRHLLIRNS